MLSRRLHSWNFARLQFYIDYKARLEDLPVEYVDPKGTSSLCPVCGEKLALNGRRCVKCDCGYDQVWTCPGWGGSVPRKPSMKRGEKAIRVADSQNSGFCTDRYLYLLGICLSETPSVCKITECFNCWKTIRKTVKKIKQKLFISKNSVELWRKK